MAEANKRPPLSVPLQEHIEAQQKTLHDKYWPQIREFVVPKNFWAEISGNQHSPPIRQHRKLLRILASYATTFFDVEARHYPLHHNNMKQWLVALAEETVVTITTELSFIDVSYHATDEEMESAIMEAVLIRANAYLSSVLGPIPLEPLAEPLDQEGHGITPTAKKEAKTKTKAVSREDRIALRDAYLSRFPDTFILDICWAAKQHYREWRRWTRGEVKDGSKPDRSFRAILTSSKRPQNYRAEQRPKTWR